MPAPASEVDTDEELVAGLVADQLPELSGPVRFLAHGWDNDLYRLGDHHVVRMPRRAVAVPLVENEQRWLPQLAPHLPVAVPSAVAAGGPGRGYPWPWSVLPWFEGIPADRFDPTERDRMAEPLADALLALHRLAPEDAPRNAYRGGPLAERDATMRTRLAGLGDERPAATAVWETALAAPPAPARRWTHGDLHPGNLLCDAEGRMTALIDFGDMSGGDPAVDLAAGWLFFTPVGRERFRARRDAGGALDPGLWARARGWAVAFSIGLMAESDGSDRMTALGRRGLAEALADQA
jgi:aminoglycoside phosphotransferase (APT) family kinase protein